MAVLQVNGMSCMHCVGSVNKALEAIEGVTNVKVDLAKKQVSFDGDEHLDAVRDAIRKIGFEPVG